jgi:curved DNA-binding protein CbpA
VKTSAVVEGEHVAEQTATVTAPRPEEESQTSDEETLDQFFIRIDNASNHYETLDVPVTADLGQIKRSYYSLARRYHPDKFHDQAQLHSRVESVFARITQAYETLTDGTARSAYDAKLTAKEKSRRLADSAPKPDKRASTAPQKPKQGEQKRTPEAGPETAENSFKEGFAALQQGQTNLAITHLATAARVAPHEPRYRAYYGRALAAHKQTRRVAETEIQAAIKLDPSNATYRVMLGELYSELGFIRRAQAEVQRALVIDPNNVAGQALLRKLETDRKEG